METVSEILRPLRDYFATGERVAVELMSNDEIDALPCEWCEGTGHRLDENGEPSEVPCARCAPPESPVVDPGDFTSEDPGDLPF